MSKIDLVPITGAYNLSAINDNFNKIEEQLNDKVLYRDNPEGEPNQVKNDVDMDDNHIYNLPEAKLDHEPVRYKEFKKTAADRDRAEAAAERAEEFSNISKGFSEEAEDSADRAEEYAGYIQGAVEGAAHTLFKFVGDGVTTDFDSGTVTLDPRNVLVFLDGVHQEPEVAYDVDGSVIQFTEAPADGVKGVAFISPHTALAIGDAKNIIIESREHGTWPLSEFVQKLPQITRPTGSDPVGGFDSAEKLRSYSGPAKVSRLRLHGFVHEMYLDEADTTTPDDGVIVIAAANGGRWKKPIEGPICANWFGAKPTISTPEQARANTEAFRQACKSYKSDWEAWASATKTGRNVYATPGDYCLSNGFTVPKGCHFDGGGLGVVRLKVLIAHADENPKLPVVSLGRVIDGTETAPCTGAYVVDPPPSIDAVYLNPQNSGVGLDITGVPGFKVGNIWAQADIAINVNGSGDGIFGSLFLENSTGTGVLIQNSQNLIFPTIYTFLCKNPMVFVGDSNNIDVGVIQANYVEVSVVQTNDNANVSRLNIEKLVCNQNEQFSTVTNVVRLRSSSSNIYIGEMDARNYVGYALNNETGLGNEVDIGRLKLRQTPNSAGYTTGTQAKGVRVNNCKVRIGYADIQGLAASPFEFAGTFAQSLTIGGGVIGTFNGSHVVEITGTQGSVNLNDVDNRSGKALFNQPEGVSVDFKGVKTPFPITTENGRNAVKIPFNGAGAYSIHVQANTNPSGDYRYRRVASYEAVIETGYTSSLVNVANLTQLAKGTNALDGYTPGIDAQVDIGSVGAGATASAAAGHLVFSVPSGYGDVSVSVDKIL